MNIFKPNKEKRKKGLERIQKYEKKIEKRKQRFLKRLAKKIYRNFSITYNQGFNKFTIEKPNLLTFNFTKEEMINALEKLIETKEKIGATLFSKIENSQIYFTIKIDKDK